MAFERLSTVQSEYKEMAVMVEGHNVNKEPSAEERRSIVYTPVGEIPCPLELPEEEEEAEEDID